MGDGDTSATALLSRLRGRFGDTSDSDEPRWKRYATVLQLLFVVAAAFGGVIASATWTVIDRTTSVARTSGPLLAEFLWPVLLGATAVAVAVCLVVVVLSVRNV